MGGSNEFYDKFSVRYHVSVIIRKLWYQPVHKKFIMDESMLVLHVFTVLMIRVEKCPDNCFPIKFIDFPLIMYSIFVRSNLVWPVKCQSWLENVYDWPLS